MHSLASVQQAGAGMQASTQVCLVNVASWSLSAMGIASSSWVPDLWMQMTTGPLEFGVPRCGINTGSIHTCHRCTVALSLIHI
eukprot:11788625-Alexandrium_andersonii.AAC.1